SDALHAESDLLQARILDLAGEEFNLASPKKLGEILFGKLGLPSDKKRGTDADKLGELAANGSEIARLLLSWRTLTKLTGTYTDALPKAIASDGRVHTTYLQTSTNTGRLSSVNPNLQNIPIRSEEGGKIRKCFVAPAGSKLITADYSQMQLRLLADIAGVQKLRAAFDHGIDIHDLTARNIFSIPTSEPVPKDKRRAAKIVNFSIVFGVSAYGLAAQLGINRASADQIIKNYLSGFPEIGDYMERTKQFAEQHGFVETPMGRRIAIDGFNNPRMKSYAIRAAINAPIQGFEADIMRIAMARLGIDPGFAPDCRMIMQVHDEFVFECPDSSAEAEARRIKNTMENIVSLSVPLVADYSISDAWEK
ncbi:MAG: DNA polymerase I, partial [Rickettsiales bacterium]|nr:DNA polymerase I [Rickettsiales bacterium]